MRHIQWDKYGPTTKNLTRLDIEENITHLLEKQREYEMDNKYYVSRAAATRKYRIVILYRLLEDIKTNKE